LITIFQSRTRQDHCLDDVPASLKRRKRMTESAPVHAVHQPTQSKTKLKRMLEKEIPYNDIPPQDKHLYEEAEQKEWKSWLHYDSCEILSPEDSKAIEENLPDRTLPSRYVFRNKNAGLLDESGNPLPVKAKGAPLTGKPDMYMRQPKQGLRGLKPGQLLKLLKPVYGRPDAPRAWYNELARILEQELGFSKCRTDPAMFVLRDEDSRLRGLMIVHVDDVMYCHDGGELGKRVEESLTKRFPFGTWLQVREQQGGVTYCGKEVKVMTKDSETCVTLAQNAFIDGRLQPMRIESSRAKQLDARANQEELTDYRSIVGSLQWLAVQSRPDIAFECNQLQKRVSDLRVADLLRANRAVREVVRNRMEILFRPLGPDAQLVTYHDAGLYSSVGAEIDEKQCDDILQSTLDKKLVYSQKGAVVGFVKRGELEQEGRVHINVIDWRSATNRRIVESSFAAETHAAIMGHNMSRFAQVLVSE
ncbi:RE1, partial [Symbiodinium necroappetens]